MSSLPVDRASPIRGAQIRSADNEAGRNKCVFINAKGVINHTVWGAVCRYIARLACDFVAMALFLSRTLKKFLA